MRGYDRPVRPRFSGPPLGLRLARTSKTVGRAFNDALATAGGSLPIWLVLSSLRGGARPAQNQLALAMGIEGPTLTRHLDALEEAGLVRRVRDVDDRRVVRVELTPSGEVLHAALLEVVIDFNRRLRQGLSSDDIASLERMLARLEANVAGSD
jgi:MarR family transcriptional regulator for hemolysin